MKLSKSQRAALNKIVAALEQAKSDTDALWEELESYSAAKSAKWQESEVGQAYRDDLSVLEDWGGEIENIAQNAPSFEEDAQS